MGKDGLKLIQEEEEEERLRWRIKKAQGKADKRKSGILGKKRRRRMERVEEEEDENNDLEGNGNISNGKSSVNTAHGEAERNLMTERQRRYFQNVSFQPQRRLKIGGDNDRRDNISNDNNNNRIVYGVGTEGEGEEYNGVAGGDGGEEDEVDEDDDTEYIYNQTTGVDRVDDICTPSPFSVDNSPNVAGDEITAFPTLPGESGSSPNESGNSSDNSS
jgi:hypothetical protein